MNAKIAVQPAYSAAVTKALSRKPAFLICPRADYSRSRWQPPIDAMPCGCSNSPSVDKMFEGETR
jgi:hypothetical protein